MGLDPRITTDRAILRQEHFEAIVWDGYEEDDPLAARLMAIVVAAERDFREEVTRQDL